jgi:anti-sigma B factor antagonist
MLRILIRLLQPAAEAGLPPDSAPVAAGRTDSAAMASVLSSTRQGDLLALTVTTPRLDAYAVRDFKASVEAAWSPVVRRASVDMSAVEFLDSSGVGALLSVYKRLPAPGSVRLENVRPAVQTVIELLRLHRIFDMGSESAAA